MGPDPDDFGHSRNAATRRLPLNKNNFTRRPHKIRKGSLGSENLFLKTLDVLEEPKKLGTVTDVS